MGSTDLLGSDPSPVFWSQIPAGNTQPYSFAVFGDWGDTDANGNNPAQAAIMNSIANSGVRFALGTGDTGYDAGTQGNYGDLYQTGYRVSSIFGPNFWAQAGDTVPFFNAVGNHGANATYFTNWPQDRVVANSGGKYAMETYCCANGANSQKSPSSWYAFDAGDRADLRAVGASGPTPTPAPAPTTAWTTRTAGSRTAPSTSGSRTICRRTRRS